MLGFSNSGRCLNSKECPSLKAHTGNQGGADGKLFNRFKVGLEESRARLTAYLPGFLLLR